MPTSPGRWSRGWRSSRAWSRPCAATRISPRRRFDEAAQSWRGLLATAGRATGEDYLAVLVDLGRPPVVGLVEPARELAAIDRERAALSASRTAEKPARK